MRSRNGQTAPPYTEAQATQWLAWLARGMQQHSQTVFLIENLQPSWLSARGQHRAYLLFSRMLSGLALGLVFMLIGVIMFVWERNGASLLEILDVLGILLVCELLFGLLFGLIGLMDVWRLGGSSVWATIRKTTPTRQIAINFLIYGLFYGVFLGLLFGLILGSSGDEMAAMLIILGLLFGLVWSIRSAYRTLTNDIKTVETLRWSWLRAVKVASVFGSLLGLLVLGLSWVESGFGSLLGLLILGLSWGLSAGLLGGLLGGFKQSIVEMKTRPNQGIKLSIRNAVLVMVLGLLAAPLVALFLTLSQGWDSWEWSLSGGVMFGAIGGLAAAVWHGGVDVIQHYVLRFILARKGHLPWKLAAFLDYAATDLHFLQKVGGGYLFIHRYLLEHFAAIETLETAPRPTAERPPEAEILQPAPA